MPQLDPQTCEAKIVGSWHLIRLEEALSTHITALKRCPVCHGPIMIKTFGKIGRPRLFHGKAHTGCPRAPTVYSGTPSLHPDQIL
jgi:hypothetical protein